MASGSCNELLLTYTEARIPHRKGLLHRNHQNRSAATETEPGNQHHKETPETTIVPLGRSTSSTTKIRKPSPADWSRYSYSCMLHNPGGTRTRNQELSITRKHLKRPPYRLADQPPTRQK
ncbi:Hypothetical predicted protein [Pelobates cultripes]|uniref:Uncharacterized protein n=1 Tax=Pelobates cultripes TaxID=61616 RepID=A0AAD1TKN5_PELCU|nr:Hypothetical predicted protein [Pelobates cultripes]